MRSNHLPTPHGRFASLIMLAFSLWSSAHAADFWSVNGLLNDTVASKATRVSAYGRIQSGDEGSIYFKGHGGRGEAEELIRTLRSTKWIRDDEQGKLAPFATSSYCFLKFCERDHEIEVFCAHSFVLCIKFRGEEAWYRHGGKDNYAVADDFRVANVLSGYLIQKKRGWVKLEEPVEDGWYFKGFTK